MEAVTCLLVDFFIEKGFEISILVSDIGKLPGSTLDKHSGLMTPMQGLTNSKENLAFIDEFICTNDIACVFNQGVFSEAYLNAPHKDVLFINTLHSCPFWEVERFKHSTLKQLLRLENTAYKRLKVYVRFVLNRIKPGLSHPFIEAFYRCQIDSVSYYVVLDMAYKKTLEKRLYGGVSNEKIRVIQNPVVIPVDASVRKKNQVLYVGRLTPEPKRVDRLLRIWQIIQSEVPDWELFILGDGKERANLEKLAVDLHLKNIHFLGYRNPVSFYKSASILCLTSTYEGFSMVLTEAQSYGIVPIAFGCVEGISSIIDHGKSGVIIEPFDEESFAQELLALIKNDSLRKLMSKNAEKKALKFSIDKIGQDWLKLL